MVDERNCGALSTAVSDERWRPRRYISARHALDALFELHTLYCEPRGIDIAAHMELGAEGRITGTERDAPPLEEIVYLRGIFRRASKAVSPLKWWVWCSSEVHLRSYEQICSKYNSRVKAGDLEGDFLERSSTTLFSYKKEVDAAIEQRLRADYRLVTNAIREAPFDSYWSERDD